MAKNHHGKNNLLENHYQIIDVTVKPFYGISGLVSGFSPTSGVKVPIITSQNGNVIVDWKDMACRYLYTFDYERSHGF